jgi:hypothetical protein
MVAIAVPILSLNIDIVHDIDIIIANFFHQTGSGGSENGNTTGCLLSAGTLIPVDRDSTSSDVRTHLEVVKYDIRFFVNFFQSGDLPQPDASTEISVYLLCHYLYIMYTNSYLFNTNSLKVYHIHFGKSMGKSYFF